MEPLNFVKAQLMDVFQASLYAHRMIGRRIRLARTARKLTLREIGEAIGVTPQAVAQWEKSNPVFEKDKSRKISEILDVDENWLNGDIGSDDVVSRREEFDFLRGRTPLCNLVDAVRYSYIYTDILGENQQERFKNHFMLTPTEKIIRRAIAIVVPKDFSDLGLYKRDIAIFDTGVKHKIGDVVLCYVFERNNIVPLFAKSVEDEEDRTNNAGVIAPVDWGDALDPTVPNDEIDIAVVGVMVEMRRLRNPDPLPI